MAGSGVQRGSLQLLFNSGGVGPRDLVATRGCSGPVLPLAPSPVPLQPWSRGSCWPAGTGTGPSTQRDGDKALVGWGAPWHCAKLPEVSLMGQDEN